MVGDARRRAAHHKGPTTHPESLWIGARSIFGNERLIGLRRREFAAGAPAPQKLIKRRLDLLLDRVRSAVAHFGMLELGMDDIDAVLLGLLGIRQHAGIGLEI